MPGLTKIDEARILTSIEASAEKYERKYRPYMQILEKHSLLRRFKPITAWDKWALGKMLDSVDEMRKMCEANGSVADLGILPRIAHDILTIAYGTSPISIIASVQPIDEELGLVYCKVVRAVSGGGNITAGDIIASAMGDLKTPVGYSAAENTEIIGTGNGNAVTFSATLAYKPVRPGTVVVTAGAVTGQDYEYDGKIIGDGIKTATINYKTGAITITFDTAPAAGTAISVTYWGNVEDLSLGIREINYELTSVQVRAKIYALKGVTGLFKSWQLQKRFGISAEEELATDLVNALNAEILGDLIRKMRNRLAGYITWDATTPSGVSYFEHKQSFKDALAGVEKKIVERSKRGAISFIIAGNKVCSVIRTMFGWEQVFDGRGIFTAHLYGNLDGIPVIRVVDTEILPEGEAIVGYKGVSEFEAPAVFAPYMPITVTSVLPTAHPLVTQRAVASWSAVEILGDRFIYGLKVTGTLPYSG